MKEPLVSSLYKSIVFIAIVLVFNGCNDSSTIGSDIFEDSILEVETLRKGITITARPVIKEPVTAFPKNICSLASEQLSAFFNHNFLAQSHDELFGDLKTEMYLGFVNDGNDVGVSELNGANVDSVILQIAYGALLQGDTLQELNLEVRRVTETLLPGETYMSDQVLQTEFLNNYSFIPQPSDTSIRIKVDNSYGNFILDLGASSINDDSVFIASNTALAVTPANDVTSTLSFLALSPFTSLQIYYSRLDTQDVIDLLIIPSSGSVHYTSYTHDYSSGLLGSVLESESFGDSLIVADALYGIETEITLSNVQLDTNNIINVAFLDIYSTEYQENLLFAPPDGLMLFTQDADGQRTRANAAQDIRIPCLISPAFNGLRSVVEVDGNNQYLYRLNLTEELQDLVINKNTTELTFRLTSSFNILETKRFVGFGAGNGNLAADVPITFTEF